MSADLHEVFLYEDESSLLDRVARFAHAGFAAGETVLILAEGRRMPELSRRIGTVGRVDMCDAHGLLDRIVKDGFLDRPAFLRMAGGLLDGAGKRARVYGELVNVLWKRGDMASAIELEEVWCEIIEQRGLPLLCGYHLDLFEDASYEGVLQGIARAHGTLTTAWDERKLDAAVTRALHEVLGPELTLQVVTVTDGLRRSMPDALRRLLWLRSNMPLTFGKVLSAARSARKAAQEPA